MAIIGSIPHFQTYPYVHQLNWLSNLESSPHSNRIRLAMMNPSQETHPRQPCTSPAGRWMTQAVTLISTVRKIIHDPDVPKTEQLFCEYWFICMIKNNITEQCASYAMNWWTLLRGIPCSPSEGLDKCGANAATNQATERDRTGLGVPHGPTLSMVWWCLMITTATHWHESCDRICALPGKFLENPGITSLFRSKKSSSSLEHHTFWDHILIQQQWWSLETDISSACFLGWNHPESHKLTQRNRRFSVVQAVKNAQNHQKPLDVYGFE